MRSIIPLLLLCTASLTNVRPLGATKSVTLYYAGGWYGDGAFRGSGVNVWLAPSITGPLAPAYTVDIEGLPASTLDGQNTGVETGTEGLFETSGAGKLAVARRPSVGPVSSINGPGGTSTQAPQFQAEAGSTGVLPGGTASTQLKNTDGKRSSVSGIKPPGFTDGSAESPSVEGTGNIIDVRHLANSAIYHNLEILKSHTSSGEAPVSTRVFSVGSGTRQSGSIREHHSTPAKSQPASTVNTEESPTTGGSTSFDALRHLEASASSRIPGTVGPLSRLLGLERTHAFEGTIPATATKISRPREASSVYNTSARENRRFGSAVGILISPSAGGSGTHYSSLAPVDATIIRTAVAGNSPSSSKAESVGNLLVGKTRAGSEKYSHNGFSTPETIRNGISVGTSESSAGLGSGNFHPTGRFLGFIHSGGTEAGTALRRQPIVGNAPESFEAFHAGSSSIHFGSNSEPNLFLPLKQANDLAAGASEFASTENSRNSNPSAGAEGFASSGISVRNIQGRHPSLETALEKASGVPPGMDSIQPQGSWKYHSFLESKPSEFAVSPAILPNEGVFKISHPSGYLAGKATPAITIAGGALREHASFAKMPASESLPSSTGGILQITRQYGSIDYKNLPSGFNVPVSESPVALGGSAEPLLGGSGSHHFTGSSSTLSPQPRLKVATESAGLPSANARGQLGSNGAYGSFIDTSLPSGFSSDSTGAPVGAGSEVFRSSERLGRFTGSLIVQAGGTPGQPLGSRNSREHEGGTPSGSARTQFENSGQYKPHVLETQASRSTVGTSESHVASLPSVHLEASPSSGNTQPVHALANLPDLSKPTQYAERTGAYGFYADTSLPSGFSISSTGAPIGAGSDVYHSSERLGFARSRIVGAGGTLGQPLGSRDSREHAGGPPTSSTRTQLENSRQYEPQELETQPSRFTVDTSESPVASLPSIHLEASPSSGNTRPVGALANLPGLGEPPQSAERTGAYGSFPDTSLPSGFSISSTGAPIGAGSDVFRSSERLGRLAGSRIVEAGGTPGQPLGSRNSREHGGGSPAGSATTQFENNDEYGPHVLETQPSRFTVSTAEFPVASLPSVHLEASPSSGNTRPVGAVANGRGLSEPPQSTEKTGAYGSFAGTSLPSGFSISSTGAPIGAGSNVFRSSGRLGGFVGSGIVRAGGTLRQPLRSRDSHELVGGFPASSATTQLENDLQFRPHVLERQPSSFTMGTSDSPAAFETSLPPVHIETSSSGNAGAVGTLEDVPGLSEPPRSAAGTGAYGSFLPTSLLSGFSISSTGAPIKARSDIFRSTERTGGSGVSGITATGGAMGQRFHSGEAREHSGGFPASNVRRQPQSTGQYESQVLERPPYYFTIGTSQPPAASKVSHSSVGFEGSPNSENAASVGPLAKLDGVREVSQSTESSLGSSIRSSATRDGYNFLSGSVGHGNLGTTGSPNDARDRIFNPPGHMGEFAGPGFTEAAGNLELQRALAGTAPPEGGFPTASGRRQLQPVQSGNRATYGSRYPEIPNSQITIGPPMSPSIAVSKDSDLSKHRAGSGGSLVTRIGGAIERPTKVGDETRSEGGFSAYSRKIQPQPNAAYGYVPVPSTPSYEIEKAKLPSGTTTRFYRPRRRLGEFTSSEIDSRPLRWLSGQRGVPAFEGVPAGSWKKLSAGSSGHPVFAPKSSTNGFSNGYASSIMENGNTISKPAIGVDDTSGSQIIGARRVFGQQLGFGEAHKPEGGIPASGGRGNSGNTGGDSFRFPEMGSSSFTTGITGSINEAGSRIADATRHFRHSADSGINTSGGNLRRQSVSANGPELEGGSLGVPRGQPGSTSGYAFMPHGRPYDTSMGSASSSNQVGSRISGASDRLGANTASGITQAGGSFGWKDGLGQLPASAGGFTARNTRGKLRSSGAYSSSDFRNEPLAFSDATKGSPNSEGSRNFIHDGRLRGLSSGFPGPYDFYRRPRVHSYSRANVDSFVSGRDDGIRNNNPGFLVSSELGSRPQTGYRISDEPPRYDGSFRNHNGGTSLSSTTGYFGNNVNTGRQRYMPVFSPSSARGHDSYVSRQEATARNRSPFSVSTSKL